MSSSCATVFPAVWGPASVHDSCRVARHPRAHKRRLAARKKALATLRTTTPKPNQSTVDSARRCRTKKSLSIMSNSWFVMVHPLGLLAVASAGLRDQGRL